MSIKYACLTVHIFKTVSAALLGRSIRNLNVSIPVILVCVDLLKLFTCSLVLIKHEGTRSAWSMVHTYVIKGYVTTAKMLVPALLYVIQNQLMFTALANLDPATFQITYQLKILTTAVFSIVLLRKQISLEQWGTLFLLTFGVILVQWKPVVVDDAKEISSPLLGVICIIIASCTSGFAGVYFEKMVKGSERSSNVWISHIQLAVCSFAVGTCNVIVTQQEHINNYGTFNEFDVPIIYSVIFAWAYGGILIGLVMKYADNMMKVFATSISIVITAAVGIFYLNDIEISLQFTAGLFCVVAANIIYPQYAIKPNPQLKANSV